MRILLVGSGGQVGRHLKHQLRPFGEVIAPIRRVCDLTVPDTVTKCCELIKPGLIVNAAGYTDVAGAEKNRELCQRVNVDGTLLLVEQAKKYGCPLIHYSSDYVFNGYSIVPYKEDDERDPLNFYGTSKMMSENIITESDIPHLIFRVSWVYDTQGVNFLMKMLVLMKKNQEVSIVGDQFGVPNSAFSVAQNTAKVLNFKKRWNTAFNRSGIYHMVADGYTSWYQFAVEIGKRVPSRKRKCVKFNYLSSAQFKGVRRPMFSVLSNEKMKKEFKVSFQDWQEIFMRDVILK